MKLLTKLCRLCLQNDDLLEYTSIYEKDTDSVDIITKIKILIPLLEFPPNNVEQCICPTCLKKLNDFVVFKTTSEDNSYKYLDIVEECSVNTQQIFVQQPSVVLPSAINPSAVILPEMPPLIKIPALGRPIVMPRQIGPKPIGNGTILNMDGPTTPVVPHVISQAVPPATDHGNPKIVAVYSIKNFNELDNQITEIPIETIKIEDNPVVKVVSPQLAPACLKRKLEITTGQPQKVIKLTEPVDPMNLPELVKLEIWNAVDNNISITSAELIDMLYEKFRLRLAPRMVENAIRIFHYNLTRTPQITEKRNSRAAIIARQHYAMAYGKYNEEKLIFVHEMGITLRMRQTIKSARQETVRIVTKEFRVEAAMTQSELIYFALSEHEYNADDFGNWIGRLLPVIHERKIDNAFLIMENCPSHQREDEVLKQGHKLIFLPPYSPFLNPLENVFSKWTHEVKQMNCGTELELMTKMQQGNQIINKERCVVCFNIMESFLKKCINKEEI